MGQSGKREMVGQVIQLFKDEVLTKLCHFRECEYPGRGSVFLAVYAGTLRASEERGHTTQFHQVSKGGRACSCCFKEQYCCLPSNCHI